MKHKTNELTCILGQHLPWNKARLTCFSAMVLALLACCTTCIHQIAVVVASSAHKRHGTNV